MQETLVSLDLETTGLDAQNASIIEIGAVKFVGDRVIETFQTLVNPGCVLPYSVQKLTGILPSDVVRAPSLDQAVSDLVPFVQNCTLVGHSLNFDLAFLQARGLKLNNPVYDTFDLAALLLPETPDFSLATVARVLGLDIPTAHRALPDAETSMLVFNALMERARKLPPAVIIECLRLAENIEWPYRGIFRDIAEEKGPLSGGGVTRGIVGSLLPFGSDDGWAGYPSLRGAKKGVRLDIDKVTGILGPGGELSNRFPGFEPRQEQVTMAKAVTRAFNEGEVLMVEAGTGTGKSIAYLLPASMFARDNETRVVVSSNTINLQEQLINKDIPDLRKCMGWDEPALRVTTLKGRSNYLCLRRWNRMREAGKLSPHETKLFLRTVVWLGATTTGDRTELRLINSEVGMWNEMCSQEENCLGARCDFNRRGHCFLYRARRKAEKAHLIITNHALTLSDLAVGNQVLPEYKYLVVDEAHHLEEEATDQFSFAVSGAVLKDYLDHLSERKGGNVYSGLLAELKARLRNSKVIAARDMASMDTQMATARDLVEITRRSSDELFARLVEFFRSQGEDQGDFDKRLRVTESLRKSSAWSQVQAAGEPLLSDLRELGTSLSKLHAAMESLGDKPFADYDNVMAELFSLVKSGEEITGRLAGALFQPEAGMIYWGVLDKEGVGSICAAPQHVGDLLQKSLFGQKDAVILTSATMSTDSNFSFIRGRLGLEESQELVIGTPFDYMNSTLLYIVKDIPEPDQPGYQTMMEKLLVDTCRATRGKTLALFTSHRALKRTYGAVKAPLEADNILVLGQGMDGSARKLVDTFKANEQSVLLGTSSLWEGVDVVGKALSVLVIARLPFSVPNDPIVAARCEEYATPFYEYMVPQSIIKFKQGFGRLIRSSRDRGVVIVMDSRIKNRPYGQTFLQSLPLCQVKVDAARNLVREVKKWLPD